MGKSQRDSLAMRFLWISLLALVLAATVQAEECLEKEKVQLGRKKCVCDLCLDMGEKCKGTAKCDKKCSGSGEVEFGGCTFTLTVKKGKGKISKFSSCVEVNADKLTKPGRVIVTHCFCISPSLKYRVGLDNLVLKGCFSLLPLARRADGCKV